MRKTTFVHFVSRTVNAQISYPTAKIIFLHIYKLQYLTCLESKLQSSTRSSSRRASVLTGTTKKITFIHFTLNGM